MKKRHPIPIKRRKRQCIGWTIFAIICIAVIVLIWRAVGTKKEPSEGKPLSEETTIHPSEFIRPPAAPTATPATFKANFTDEEITIAAKTVWGEARGIESQMEQAAVVWCALNRYDNGHGESLESIFTEPHQFHYDESFSTVDDYGRDLTALVRDVVGRWEREKNGETNVGRVLPSEYIYFGGDGTHNYFRDDYNFNGNIWDWSLPNPYEN